jgi:hypothetical protein
VRYEVSHPYKTTDKIIVFYILIKGKESLSLIYVLDKRQEDK